MRQVHDPASRQLDPAPGRHRGHRRLEGPPGRAGPDRQLPDGVLEARTAGQAESDIFILEIATFPDARVPSQAARDMAMIYLQKGGIVPELLVLFLHKKGHVPAADSVELRSRRGLTKWNLSWKAIKVWQVPAEDLIATGDVGLIPWVPLAKFQGSPEQIVRRCRARWTGCPAVAQAEHENLLAVTQFLLPFRYNKGSALLDRLRGLLGGRKAMIESPIYQEIVEESERNGGTEGDARTSWMFLLARFGPELNHWKSS